MSKWLNTGYTDLGLLVLRVTFGLMLVVGHGIAKLKGFNEMFHAFGDPIGLGSELSYLLATGAEVFCALAIVVGFCTRLASIPLLILFTVIYFFAMGDKPFFMKEFVVMYFVAFLTLFLTGPGKYSFDNWWCNKKA